MAVSVALNGAGCAGSVALLHYLVPARIPYKSREKHVFEVKTSVGETSLGQGVALNGACRTI